MIRAVTRVGRRVLLSLTALLTVMGMAAVPMPQETAHTYALAQAGAQLGTVELTTTRDPHGTVSTGHVDLPALMVATSELKTNPDGSASAYSLQGVAGDVEFAMNVEFSDEGALLKLTQAGATQEIPVPSPEPLYVFDNNFLDGFQIAADQVMAAGEGRAFAALVPQVAALGVVAMGDPVQGAVEYQGELVTVTRIDAQMVFGPQALPLSLYLDEAGEILVLTNDAQAIRYERELPQDVATLEVTDEANIPRPASTESSCYTERDVTVSSTDEQLVGKLTLPAQEPAGQRGAPTLLLLPGSGPVDMDGNVLPLISNSAYAQIAHELACHGFGVLRAAKLGIPPSTGNANAVTVNTYASNIADWFTLLEGEPGVDARRLGLIGHSEGGLLALYATAEGHVSPRAVVLLATPGRDLGALVREQLLAQGERAGYNQAALEELDGKITAALAAIASSQEATLELTTELVENEVAVAFAPTAGYLRSVMGLDPALLATRVTVPTLVMQGGKDVQVKPLDAELLSGSLRQGTLLLFRDLGHVLNAVHGDPMTGVLLSPEEPVAPELLQSLTTWLNAYLKAVR